MQISLKAARVNSNLSQKEVSVLINKSVSTICEYEKGSTIPRWDTFEKLCDIYGLKTSDVFLPKQ